MNSRDDGLMTGCAGRSAARAALNRQVGQTKGSADQFPAGRVGLVLERRQYEEILWHL